MISFRYHVVSIVAVLLALAAGVALGGGPLSEIGRGGDEATERAEERSAELAEQLDEADAVDTFQDQFAGALAPQAVGGKLTTRPVVLVKMPGADEQVVKAIQELLTQAGASVSGSYVVSEGLLDPEQKPLVDTLGRQLLETVTTTGIPATASTYDRIGQLLGWAAATPTDIGAPLDEGTTESLNSLKGAELVTQDQAATGRGSLAVVVLGDEPADPGAVDKLYAALFTGIAEHTDGVVLAGTSGSAGDGLLAALRDDVTMSANVSTADAVETTAGRVAAILALALDASGKTGHYGSAGIDGAVPRG